MSQIHGGGAIPKYGHADAPNPLVGTYRTKDGRYVQLMMLQLDKFYPEAMHAIGLPELVDDPRFADPAARYQNRGELIRLMDDAFARRTLAEWRAAWRGGSPALGGDCADTQRAVRRPGDHRQRLCRAHHHGERNALHSADESGAVRRAAGGSAGAPEHGQHTEEILMDAGLDWDTIMAYKESGAIL